MKNIWNLDSHLVQRTIVLPRRSTLSFHYCASARHMMRDMIRLRRFITDTRCFCHSPFFSNTFNDFSVEVRDLCRYARKIQRRLELSSFTSSELKCAAKMYAKICTTRLHRLNTWPSTMWWLLWPTCWALSLIFSLVFLLSIAASSPALSASGPSVGDPSTNAVVASLRQDIADFGWHWNPRADGQCPVMFGSIKDMGMYHELLPADVTLPIYLSATWRGCLFPALFLPNTWPRFRWSRRDLWKYILNVFPIYADNNSHVSLKCYR